jgi:hypothetical protein
VPTETPEAAVDYSGLIGLNDLATQESGGIRIEIARLSFIRKGTLGEAADRVFDTVGEFRGANILGVVWYRVSNMTDQIVNINVHRGTAVINGEQIVLEDSYFVSRQGDDISDEIFPGATLIGGQYFPVKRSDIPDIQRVILGLEPPLDQGFGRLGEAFYFDLDISDHNWQAVPEDLK